jgi:hypothetical protein
VSRGASSRIVGMGRLIRSLRALIRRVDKFAAHRVCTSTELRWANVLADELEYAYSIALANEAARASLDAVDRRAAVQRKTPTAAPRGVSATIS